MRTLKIQKRYTADEHEISYKLQPADAQRSTPASWTIVLALNNILDGIEETGFNDDLWQVCDSAISFLTHKFQMTPMQVLFIAVLTETGEPLSWRGIAKYLHVTRVSVMTYSEDLEGLIARRWVIHSPTRELGRNYDGFALTYGVVTALRHNEVFVPEKIDGLTIQEFVDKMELYLDKTLVHRYSEFQDAEYWLLQLCEANPQLPLCREVLQNDDRDIHMQTLLLLAVYNYAQYADSCDEGVSLNLIEDVYPDDYECYGMRRYLCKGTYPLITRGYLEHKCEDGIANTQCYVLTDSAKKELLEGYTPSRTKCGEVFQGSRGSSITLSTSIREKTMYYNPSEEQQIARLTSLLSQDNLPSIMERLSSEGFRKGFACLFYGAPGTGKTETALQIARQTGRDIMLVDIAAMRDKYVGESEKNIRRVFLQYRSICKRSKVMPILFFNEADAIISKRTSHIERSVEKMDNAMQNIILQEIENLDGILIATTNLTSNLDDAFDRRFLFKVEFHNPTPDVKARLWTSMLGTTVSADEAQQLATQFDFSGGQIENIARKRTIEYILTGHQPTYSDIVSYCRNEQLNRSNRRQSIQGFR